MHLFYSGYSLVQEIFTAIWCVIVLASFLKMEQEKLFTAVHKCIYVRTSHIYSLIWVNFDVWDWNTVVLSMCEYLSYGRHWRYVIACVLKQYDFENVKNAFVTSVLRHRVHHFHFCCIYIDITNFTEPSASRIASSCFASQHLALIPWNSQAPLDVNQKQLLVLTRPSLIHPVTTDLLKIHFNIIFMGLPPILLFCTLDMWSFMGVKWPEPGAYNPPPSRVEIVIGLEMIPRLPAVPA